MRLLVVEDYAPLRQSLEQGLTEAGFAVDAASEGKEGLWFAQGTGYDAVILALMLPGLDGLSLLQRLRRAGNGCPVLILTAKGDLEDRLAGFGEGADDYLVKPFAFAELLARVHALVRGKHDVGLPAVEVGGLTVDPRSKRASWRGEAVDLTAREFSLLELLAMRRGEVLSRSEICEHIYEFDGEPNSNAIDVRIAQLRRKLDAAGAPPLIQTRRGQGYVLEEVAA